jgi:hypothetical protein
VNPSLLLFAQQNRPPDGAAAAAGVMVFALICFYAVILIVAVAMAIWFYVTAYQALSAVSPRNRDMEPGAIFLMLIPLFGIVWYFFVIIRVADSLQREFDDRGLSGDGDFGKMMGILAPIIPCVGFIMHIMWIMKIRGYTAQLAKGGGKRRRSRDDDDDDDDDDRPRRKRRRDDDD